MSSAAQRAVIDASALLALINAEPGADRVAQALESGALVSAVNLSEVLAKLADYGMPDHEAAEVVMSLELEVIAFDVAAASQAAWLRPATRPLGLSFGDRACLALAQTRHLPVLTADRPWARLDIGVPIELVR